MQDALLSDNSLAMLAGTEVKKTGIKAVGRDVLTVDSDKQVETKNTPTGKKVTIFKVEKGIMADEITTFTELDGVISFTSGAEEDDQVMVFYEYEVTGEATQVTFSGSQFPATYKVVGDTVVRGEDGVDRQMQFIIPKAKLQSGFTMTMDAENVSTFDFNLEVLVETGTQTLYDIIRIG